MDCSSASPAWKRARSTQQECTTTLTHNVSQPQALPASTPTTIFATGSASWSQAQLASFETCEAAPHQVAAQDAVGQQASLQQTAATHIDSEGVQHAYPASAPDGEQGIEQQATLQQGPSGQQAMQQQALQYQMLQQYALQLQGMQSQLQDVSWPQAPPASSPPTEFTNECAPGSQMQAGPVATHQPFMQQVATQGAVSPQTSFQQAAVTQNAPEGVQLAYVVAAPQGQQDIPQQGASQQGAMQLQAMQSQPHNVSQPEAPPASTPPTMIVNGSAVGSQIQADSFVTHQTAPRQVRTQDAVAQQESFQQAAVTQNTPLAVQHAYVVSAPDGQQGMVQQATLQQGAMEQQALQQQALAQQHLFQQYALQQQAMQYAAMQHAITQQPHMSAAYCGAPSQTSSQRRPEESKRPRPRVEPTHEARPEDLVELQEYRDKHANLDSRALAALEALPPMSALKALKDLDAKQAKEPLRNPSAWLCRVAQNMRDRESEGASAPQMQLPPPPPEMSAPGQGTDVVDHYGALEVGTSADEGAIKKAYRKLVIKWHPDKHPADREEAEVKIRAINEAYEILSNPTKRAAYDGQRVAIERLKQAAAPPVDLEAQPRHHIPREFMLQPMGAPDKFVRYSGEVHYSGDAQASCFVHSRSDATTDGRLAQFDQFFQACKLSLWWLPQVKNMCRIRAMEVRTRSTRGEAVVAGRAGGMNLGFNIDLKSMTDSGVILMDARKGEKDEHVNFIVQPSPWYTGAWRFEAAERRGWFLCFQPPTYLRMVAQAPNAISHIGCVLDFTLVDFAVMSNFIDIAEILVPLCESVPEPGWILLDQLKCDPNIIAYFMNILQVPIWSNEDFQTYFDGHFDMWEVCFTPCFVVRLRRTPVVWS